MVNNNYVIRIMFIPTCLLWVIIIHAQQPISIKPDVMLLKVSAGTQTAVVPATAYPSAIKINYVRTKEAVVPVVNEAMFDGAGYREVKQVTQYIDGLGRPLQSVVRQATAGDSPKDLVSPVIYDSFGRETYRYLPYVQTKGIADGSFKSDPFRDQQIFYRSEYKDVHGKPVVDGEQFLYSRTEHEPSPLGRVRKEMAAGNSWVGSGRGIEHQYLVNSAADSVCIWTIGYDGLTYRNDDVNTNIPVSGGMYKTGELYKHVTKDEHGNAIVEYKDKEGQVVMKKVQAGEVSGDYSGHDNWLCTYYVYDDFNRLRFVIPPKAVEAIKTNWSLSTPSGDLINELCFRYEYDRRGRMVAKKVPGAGWVWMVYDSRDRLVFTQDKNLREKGWWMATLYDGMNRAVATGMMERPAGWQELQRHVDSVRQGITTVEIADAGARVEAEMNPLPAAVVFTALTLTHYDGYTSTTGRYTSVYNTRLDAGSNAYGEVLPSEGEQRHVSVRGMVTGTMTRVLEDANNLKAGRWLRSVLFYDRKGRLLQTQGENYKGGRDVITNRYDFSGRLISTYLNHSNAQGTPQTLSVKTGMNYDHGGRLVEVWKTMKNDEASRVLITRNAYDEMGQLKRKELGQKRVNGVYSAMPVETLDYTYNIRGWLKGINAAYSHPELSLGVNPDRWFGMELSYDWGSLDKSMNQYNGNISLATWRSRGDGVRRAYGYSYDPANRLLGGDFSEHNGTAYADNSTVNFDMVMGEGREGSAYDQNGNIKKMKQWGFKLTGSTLIDHLTYSYHTNSNKLRAVSEDQATATANKLGDFTDKSAGADDYGYDRNGNMITDLNKGITGATGIDQVSGGAVEYNHMNLPWKITIKNDDGSEKGVITYIYDASGTKLEKRVHDNTNAAAADKATTYIGAMVYEQNLLQFISHEEGRTRLKTEGSQTTYINDYFIKDHLGNVRMVLTDEEEQSAYPAASLEAASLDKEKAYYKIPDDASVRVNRNDVPGYPTDTYTRPNDYVHKLNGSATKVGSSIVLKVMSGDRVNIRASSWYRQNGATPGIPQDMAQEIIASLAEGIAGAGAGKFSSTQLQQPGILTPGVVEFLMHETNNTPGVYRPKAYLSWLLLDEQMKPVITNNGKNSGFEQVGADLEFKIHQVTGREITKSGYLYIYVSNETPNINVFFDNLQVTHIKGPLLEETHYYPFGLTMAGISSKAAGSLTNRYKFNSGNELQSEEFRDGSGLELYETKYRSMDPQIGRFWQVDPLSQMSYTFSPYAYGNNNPILFNDPLGLLSDSSHPIILSTVKITPKPKVQVFIWSKEEGKDVGHTAVRINNVVYGYYPSDDNGNNVYDMSELLGSKGEMHVNSISEFNKFYAGQEVTYYQLNLTPEQAKKLEKILMDIVKNPEEYKLLAGNQCTSVATNALLKAGVQIGTAPTIEGNKLISGYGLSPNNLKIIFNTPINKNLITRSIKFIVGK